MNYSGLIHYSWKAPICFELQWQMRNPVTIRPRWAANHKVSIDHSLYDRRCMRWASTFTHTYIHTLFTVYLQWFGEDTIVIPIVTANMYLLQRSYVFAIASYWILKWYDDETFFSGFKIRYICFLFINKPAFRVLYMVIPSVSCDLFRMGPV